jgi:hypothetical protein
MKKIPASDGLRLAKEATWLTVILHAQGQLRERLWTDADS